MLTYFRKKENYSFTEQNHYSVLSYVLGLYTHTLTDTPTQTYTSSFYQKAQSFSNKLECTEKVFQFFLPLGKVPALLLTLGKMLNLNRIETKHTASASQTCQGSQVGLSSQANLKFLPRPWQLSYLTLFFSVHLSELFGAGLLYAIVRIFYSLIFLSLDFVCFILCYFLSV